MMHRQQKGFGLIELMISLLVSVIIMGGLYGLLTSSIVNFGFSKASSDAVDTGHRVDNFINTMLFQSGFVNYDRLVNGKTLAKDTAAISGYPDWQEMQFIYSPNNSNAVLIRFYGSSAGDDTTHFGEGVNEKTANGFVLDCAGVAVGRDTLVTALLQVTNDGLQCTYVDGNANVATVAAKGTTVTIDPTVKDIRFEFGSTFDKHFGSDANTSGFFTANVINGNDNLSWNSVDIIRYSFVTAQPSNQKLVKSNAVLHHFNEPFDESNHEAEVKYGYKIPDADAAKVHRVITGTVYLVNVQKN